MRVEKNCTFRILSYVLDWLIVVIAVIVFQRIGKIAGHRQRFALSDIYIQYDYTGRSTIPNYALVLLSVVFPAVTILVATCAFDADVGIKRQSGFVRLLYRLNTSWLGLAVSICLSQVFTNVLKITIGRPRPDLLARCTPSADAMDVVPFELSTSSICTQTDLDLLNDGFRSFPSGHSSMAFSGLAYLTLFLAWRMSLFNRSGETWKWTIVMLPLLVASLIAITRIMDNRHHPFDVLFGSALGVVTSFVGFYQYHPRLHRQDRFPLRFPDKRELALAVDDTNHTSQRPITCGLLAVPPAQDHRNDYSRYSGNERHPGSRHSDNEEGCSDRAISMPS